MAPNVDEISTAFITGYVTPTADEQRLAQTVYRLLATGQPARPEANAAAAGCNVDDVGQLLVAWPAVVRNDGGAG